MLMIPCDLHLVTKCFCVWISKKFQNAVSLVWKNSECLLAYGNQLLFRQPFILM